MAFSWLVYWSGLPFPPSVDHILSELSTVTHLSWVALYSISHSFTELHIEFHKAPSQWQGSEPCLYPCIANGFICTIFRLHIYVFIHTHTHTHTHIQYFFIFHFFLHSEPGQRFISFVNLFKESVLVFIDIFSPWLLKSLFPLWFLLSPFFCWHLVPF